MPQSLSVVYLHLVFSTKDRRPFLRDPIIRGEMHAWLGSASGQLGCPSVLVGGVEDHVHVLARLGRTISQADWVKELKRTSSIWIKERDPQSHDFA
jgi:putative transposase